MPLSICQSYPPVGKICRYKRPPSLMRCGSSLCLAFESEYRKVAMRREIFQIHSALQDRMAVEGVSGRNRGVLLDLSSRNVIAWH